MKYNIPHNLKYFFHREITSSMTKLLLLYSPKINDSILSTVYHQHKSYFFFFYGNTFIILVTSFHIIFNLKKKTLISTENQEVIDSVIPGFPDYQT